MRRAMIVAGFAIALTAGAQTKEYERGHSFLAHGSAEEAVVWLEKAVALSPGNARYHCELGNAYAQVASNSGMFKAMSIARRAKAEWLRAVEVDPNFLPGRFALLEFDILAPAAMGGGESDTLEQAKEIGKRDPVEGRRALARIAIGAKKLDQARSEYERMVQEHPQSAAAHYYYGGYLLTSEKKYKEAAAQFDAALRIDPSHMRAYFRIGQTAAMSGTDLARGEQALKKYSAYTPGDEEPATARAWYWLGVIYEKEHRVAEAKASYAESLRLNASQKDVAEAMKALR